MLRLRLPFASRIARELQVNRTGGNPISSVQFSCSKSYMGDRVITLCSLPLLLLLHISIPLLPRLFPSYFLLSSLLPLLSLLLFIRATSRRLKLRQASLLLLPLLLLLLLL